MSCLQLSSCQPRIFMPNKVQSLRLPPKPLVLPLRAGHRPKTFAVLVACVSAAKCKHKHKAPVCLFGGIDKSGFGDEGTQFNKGPGNFNKEKSIEEILKEQIQKQEYYEDGGGNPPGGRGGRRGGGGGGDGSGESNEEGFAGMVDETVQVVLATIGFIFVYLYIITGEELIRLTKDFVKYLFGGEKSARLSRAMQKWESLFERLNQSKNRVVDKFGLEKAIISTRTWWDGPEKYMQLASEAQAQAHSQSQAQSQSQSQSQPESQSQSQPESDSEDGYDSDFDD